MKSAPFKISDHFDGKTFLNPGRDVAKGLLDVFKWKLTERAKKWPDWIDDNALPEVASKVAQGDVVLTFVNHASMLIQLPGLNVLTDPIYSERVSPFSSLGPRRHRAPGVAFENLPPLDVVFVSHNHYDHLDVATIKRLAKKHAPLFITPLGNKKLLQTAGAKKVIELDWWQSTRLPSGEVFLLTQVHHWSARTMFDRNKALWGGLVIEASGLKIYFGGDSGYGPHYKETRRRYGAMDLSLLPIGAYEPRWFMKDQHMNPAEAVQAHLDLGSRFSVGMHFGTFQLTDEAVESPAIELQEALIQANLKPSVFTAPKNGETELYRLQKTKPLSREF